MRAPIDGTETTHELLYKMSEGNPGALSVLVKLIQHRPDDWLLVALHLDDMNIRGSQIWRVWRDHSEEDLTRFCEQITSRDAEMIRLLNDYPSEERAVAGGASFTRAGGAGR